MQCEGALAPLVGTLVAPIILFVLLLLANQTKKGKELVRASSKRLAKIDSGGFLGGNAGTSGSTEMWAGQTQAEQRDLSVSVAVPTVRLPNISLPSLIAAFRVKFPHLEWPDLPDIGLPELRLPQLTLPEFAVQFPDLIWPNFPQLGPWNIDLPCLFNFLRIAFPNLEWPQMPPLHLPEWQWPELFALQASRLKSEPPSPCNSDCSELTRLLELSLRSSCICPSPCAADKLSFAWLTWTQSARDPVATVAAAHSAFLGLVVL